MPLFPSEEWLDDYVDRINASPEYREAAATWEGDVGLRLRARARQGRARGDLGMAGPLARRVPGRLDTTSTEEGGKARFIIRAPYSRWKEVIRKELDPVKGMMQGKLKLRGDLPTIVRYVQGRQRAGEPGRDGADGVRGRAIADPSRAGEGRSGRRGRVSRQGAERPRRHAGRGHRGEPRRAPGARGPARRSRPRTPSSPRTSTSPCRSALGEAPSRSATGWSGGRTCSSRPTRTR